MSTKCECCWPREDVDWIVYGNHLWVKVGDFEALEEKLSAAEEELQTALSVADMAAHDRDEALMNFDTAALELEAATTEAAQARQRIEALETAAYTLVPMSDGSVVRVCRVCQHGTRGRGEHSDECWYGSVLAAATQEDGAGEHGETRCDWCHQPIKLEESGASFGGITCHSQCWPLRRQHALLAPPAPRHGEQEADHASP